MPPESLELTPLYWNAPACPTPFIFQAARPCAATALVRQPFGTLAILNQSHDRYATPFPHPIAGTSFMLH
jgi:hypothetical protein